MSIHPNLWLHTCIDCHRALHHFGNPKGESSACGCHSLEAVLSHPEQRYDHFWLSAQLQWADQNGLPWQHFEPSEQPGEPQLRPQHVPSVVRHNHCVQSKEDHQERRTAHLQLLKICHDLQHPRETGRTLRKLQVSLHVRDNFEIETKFNAFSR